MDETTYLKISCTSCSEHVEFPSEMRMQIVPCPHCNFSLLLDMPEPPPLSAAPVQNLYQRLRALKDLEQKPLDISLPEAFTKPPDSQG
jgi:DNA-directed RNA polymerase subunit RPC12/RpoP